MPIYVGGSKQGDLYVGGQKISEAYVGSQKVYSSGIFPWTMPFVGDSGVEPPPDGSAWDERNEGDDLNPAWTSTTYIPEQNRIECEVGSLGAPAARDIVAYFGFLPTGSSYRLRGRMGYNGASSNMSYYAIVRGYNSGYLSGSSSDYRASEDPVTSIDMPFTVTAGRNYVHVIFSTAVESSTQRGAFIEDWRMEQTG